MGKQAINTRVPGFEPSPAPSWLCDLVSVSSPVPGGEGHHLRGSVRMERGTVGEVLSGEWEIEAALEEESCDGPRKRLGQSREA